VVIDLSSRAKDIAKTKTRDPDADVSCEACVRRYGLALLYTENEEMRKAWESLEFEGEPVVKPWPYWNNTDKPDDLTDEEWDRRGKDCDEALGGHGCLAPAECGLSRILVPVGWFWFKSLTREVKAELAEQKGAHAVALKDIDQMANDVANMRAQLKDMYGKSGSQDWKNEFGNFLKAVYHIQKNIPAPEWLSKAVDDYATDSDGAVPATVKRSCWSKTEAITVGRPAARPGEMVSVPTRAAVSSGREER
jgi:hypothetical protein